MTEQNQWVSKEANQAILQGIRDVISQRITSLHGAEHAHELEAKIQTMQTELERQYFDWIEDEPSKFHLRLMSCLLASYRALTELMPQAEALTLVKTALLEPNRAALREGVGYALDHAPAPMSVLVDASKAREAEFFGQTFTFERQQDDDRAYILLVKRCFYQRFAVANGAPELMQILCEWDWLWATAIEPAKHGFGFELPTTLGYGGDACRFCFRRTD